jgi:hypothetical protein
MTLKQLLYTTVYTEIRTTKIDGHEYYTIKDRTKQEAKPTLLYDAVCKSFAYSEFVTQVELVLQMQEKYFKTKDPKLLDQCKDQERLLKQMLHRIKNFDK